MQINKKIIREYDIRGIYDQTLSKQDAYLIGVGLVEYLKKHNLIGKIAVCRDGRHSSPSLSKELVKGILENGYDVIDLGVAPTPLLYYSNFVVEGTIAGVMVTGSHNPANYNGFKFIVNKLPFYGQQIVELASFANNAMHANQPGVEICKDLQEDYVNFLASRLRAGEGLKIVWDAGNGATGAVLEMLAKKLPGKHILLNTKIDGDFPVHHPDPTVEENLIQLIAEVKQNNADFGIAFDGDGDRIGIVNRDGKIVWGDQILAILSKDVTKRLGNVPIIADVKSSKKLFDKIQEFGGQPVMWKTGHSNIKTKILELNSPLAGEMSGHIFFKDGYFGYDDALFAAIQLINCFAEDSKCIDNILTDFEEVANTPEIRITCPEEKKFQIIDQIKTHLKSQNMSFNDIDGIRMDTGLGWWLVRASNTQNVLVVRIEGNSPESLIKLKKEFGVLLANFGVSLAERKVL